MARWGRAPPSLAERFNLGWVGEPNSGCWLWTESALRSGYGSLCVGPRKSRKYLSTHRLSWELHHGPIPDGLWVLHKCDTPACVNPLHLFLGTRLDNIADQIAKGRVAKGTMRSKRLTDETIREIRGSKDTGRSLSKRFKVSEQLVSSIRNRRSWKHIL